MHDGTEKPIEQITAGELIMGIDGSPNKVLELHLTRLGDSRSMLMFADGSLRWSEEHPLWVQKGGDEYWGVWGYGAYLLEMNQIDETLPESVRYFGLKKRLPMPLWGQDSLYAHVDGWKPQRMMVDRSGYSFQQLYDLIVDGTGTMIANGYVLSAFADDSKFDFANFRWGGLHAK